MKIITFVLLAKLAASSSARSHGLRHRLDNLHGRLEDSTTPTIMQRQAKEMRIVGGEDVPAGVFPFFVQFTLGCGGSLIASDMVLTVAHVSTLIANMQSSIVSYVL